MNIKRRNGILIEIIKLGSEKEVSDCRRTFRKNIDLSVNAAEPPHILIFKIRAVRIPVHLGANNIFFASFHKFGDIKFMRRHRALGIAHIIAVNIHFKTGFARAEVNKDLSFFPLFIQSKCFSVKADFLHFMVYFRDTVFASADRARKRACVIIRHRIALCLPDGGHLYLSPLGIIETGILKILRLVFKTPLPIKFPHSV